MRQPADPRNWVRAITLGAVGIVSVASGVLEASESTTELRYAKRVMRAQEAPSKSGRAVLPEDLKVAVPIEADPMVRPMSGDLDEQRDARRTRPPLHDRGRAEDEHGDWYSRLDARARAAGAHAAQESLRASGRREYYRVGFYQGLRIGLNESPEPRWAWFEGQRAGHRDPDARSAGRDAGRISAEGFAIDAAQAHVRAEFGDLSRDPRFLPATGVPRHDPRPPDLAAPRLRDVVNEYPVLGFNGFRDDPREFLVGFEFDTWQLIHCPDYTRFYDATWAGVDSAWSHWRAHHGRRLGFSQLDPWEQERFANVFASAFERELAVGFDRYLGRAYDSGFEAGWFYSSFLNEEMRYREGYQAGYRETFVRHSRLAFDRVYTRAYRDAYGSVFEDWSESAKLEIGDVRLSDSDDDGVFSPGERLIVEYTLINYGGAGGEFAVELDGGVLDGPAIATASAPARMASPRVFTAARIAGDVTPRTRSQVELSVAGASRRAALTVSYPLLLARQQIRTFRDNLSGELIVEIPVENVSRRPVEGAVRIGAGPGVSGSGALGTIEPNERRSVTLALSGLDPLSLIAGDVTLGIEVVAAGTVHDRYRRHLPDVYRDLESRELLEFMVGLALGEVPNPSAAARTRELMIQRLREDWKVAAIGSGNPYKSDLRHGMTETALGDLVRTFADERDRLRNSAVFAGLSGDVLSLSRTLPGTHPFLRKYVRRLANELP